MAYLVEFHWWYVAVGLALFVMIFGKAKGGAVAKRYFAFSEVLEERFLGCAQEAEYLIFKEGEPDKIDIEKTPLAIIVSSSIFVSLELVNFKLSSRMF